MTSQNLPRSVRLRAWMKEHFIKNTDLAYQLGVTPQRISRMLREETMPSVHHAACLRLGFPEELLPQPYDKRLHRESSPVPVFPGLLREDGGNLGFSAAR